MPEDQQLLCPLDGSWSQSFCSLYNEVKKNCTYSTCIHQFECARLREVLENDVNLSTVMTKRILHLGIPQAL